MSKGKINLTRDYVKVEAEDKAGVKSETSAKDASQPTEGKHAAKITAERAEAKASPQCAIL